MMLALGVGAYGAAIFHLFTHAFFKALLFLGSGSVNHATGTFDMRYMGGLRKAMPITFITFLIGSLSLAGIFPLAGFWSKDEILLNAFADGTDGNSISMLVFALALIALFMTAFYMFRAMFMTFGGSFRGGSDKDPEAHAHGPVHLGESPISMILPMVLLAVPAVIIGYVANPFTALFGIEAHWMSHTLEHWLPNEIKGHVAEEFNILLAIISSLIAILGIILAYMMYKSEPIISPEAVSKPFKPIHTLFYRKYYFDELYEGIIVKKVYYGSIALVLDWTDRNIVDRIVNIIGWTGTNIGGLLRQIQNGQLQMYATATSIGVIAIAAIFIFGR